MVPTGQHGNAHSCRTGIVKTDFFHILRVFIQHHLPKITDHIGVDQQEDYKRRSDTLSNKEKDAYGDMKIVQEMYARGFEFVPIDIFSAQSRLFQIVDGKLMPSLNSIDGLGEKAADAIVEAAKDGSFLSKDDFRQRTKVSKTIIDLMDSLGILGELPESNQISIFDFV